MQPRVPSSGHFTPLCFSTAQKCPLSPGHTPQSKIQFFLCFSGHQNLAFKANVSDMSLKPSFGNSTLSSDFCDLAGAVLPMAENVARELPVHMPRADRGVIRVTQRVPVWLSWLRA